MRGGGYWRMLGTAEVVSRAGDKPGGCNKRTLGTTCVGRCSVGGEATGGSTTYTQLASGKSGTTGTEVS